MKKLIIFILFLLIHCKEEVKKNASLEENKNLAKAKEYRDSGNEDSAYVYYLKAKEELLAIKNNTEAARAITNIAIIECNKGDYHSSIKNSIDAEKLLQNKNDTTIASIASRNYNSIAIASKNLKNYADAITYYKLAMKTAPKKVLSLAFNNNIGDTYLELKKPEIAKLYFTKALQTNDSVDYARALNNLAKANFLENPVYNAYPELEKALKIRMRKKDDDAEITSSFATLADFYFNKNPEEALFYGNKMYQIALKNKNPDDQLEALNKIIFLNPKNYLQNFNKYVSLRDSLQNARNNNFHRFGLIKFNVEKQKRDNEELKNKIFQQAIGLVFLVLILIIGFLWYRKRKKRLEQEKELEVKNTQLKMSKKVHDVVANGLYHMMIDVQNNPEMDKTKILNGIEKMYEESRDISHENIIEEDFPLRFINMIKSYSSPNQKVLPVGYKENIWESISYDTQLELYYIVREILVNMKKHSQAKLASVKFEKDGAALKIRYTDNGIGINELKKGAGIHNTENRIETIGGDITFEKNPTGGLIIQITIPINSKYV